MSFEADYYEAPGFWSDGIIEDAANLKRLEETVALVPAGTRSMIDVGCGNGVFARLLKRRMPVLKLTCVDRSATALEHVEADAKMRCEVVDLPFDDRTFDCVSCLEVIEHLTVNDYVKALSELTRVSKGIVIISVPYKERIGDNVDKCPQCQTIFNRDLHFRSFDDKQFSELLSDFGFRLSERSIPVRNTHYLGFRTYYKLKRQLHRVPDRSTLFLSPICPLCGYVPPKELKPDGMAQMPRQVAAASSGASNVAGLKAFLKRVWPKQVTPGYWIVGRFERSVG